jgi:hypothetical protein
VRQENRVQRYTREGRFLGCRGSYGSNDGEFNMPRGITVDRAGDIYGAAWRSDRIQKSDADGRFITRFGSPIRARPSSAGLPESPLTGMAIYLLPTGETNESNCWGRKAGSTQKFTVSPGGPN